MIHYEKYNKEKMYHFPAGTIADYEAIKKMYPVDDFTFVVSTDYTGSIIVSISMINMLRTSYNIDTELTDDEAIEELNRIANQETPVSDYTRIADSLEDLVVINMPDVEEE